MQSRLILLLTIDCSPQKKITPISYAVTFIGKTADSKKLKISEEIGKLLNIKPPFI